MFKHLLFVNNNNKGRCFILKSNKYIKILSVICNNYNISEEDFLLLLKEKESKYMILLLMKKYRCINEEELTQVLRLASKRVLKYNIKKAEEKLLINRDFRERYFEIEADLLK